MNQNKYLFDCRKRFARASFLLLFLLCGVISSAQQVEVTLNEAGTLPEKIDSVQKYSITSLKVSGPINGTDVRYLREMAGKDYGNNDTDGKLVDLDLTDAKIVEGGDRNYYYNSYSQKNDTIGSCMFYQCKLESIKLPNSVASIGGSAFKGCIGLTSVTIPNSVTSIGGSAFKGCTGLTSVTIPNSMTSIGGSAFKGCTGLTSVTIPNSMTSIGGSAFKGCTGLTSVTIPNSMTSIGGSAFKGCTGLTSVTIPNSVTSIGEDAFNGCTSLTSVTIPNSVTSIYGTFSGCTSLTSITIPNSVTRIGEGAFNGCSSLTSVTIPNSVTRIGSYAFKGCSSLTSVTIPNSATSIGWEAFRGCTGLTSATIGNSVTSIDYYAFAECSAIVKLTSLSTIPPKYYSDVFVGIDKSNCTLYVPINSVSAYKTTYPWNTFFNIEGFDSTDISMPGSKDSNKTVKRYDTNGRLTDKPTKGLNILKMSDGTTKKVMVK